MSHWLKDKREKRNDRNYRFYKLKWGEIKNNLYLWDTFNVILFTLKDKELKEHTLKIMKFVQIFCKLIEILEVFGCLTISKMSVYKMFFTSNQIKSLIENINLLLAKAIKMNDFKMFVRMNMYKHVLCVNLKT